VLKSSSERTSIKIRIETYTSTAQTNDGVYPSERTSIKIRIETLLILPQYSSAPCLPKGLPLK